MKNNMQNIDIFLKNNKFESIKDMLEICSNKYENKIAFAYKKFNENICNVTFREVNTIVSYFGNQLILKNIYEGNCAIIGELCFEWIITYFSIIAIGGIVVPIDQNNSIFKTREIVEQSNCKFIFVTTRSYQKLYKDTFFSNKVFIIIDSPNMQNEIMKAINLSKKTSVLNFSQYKNQSVDSDSVCEIVYTSGTTGLNKGVMLSQKNIIINAIEANKLVELTDRTMCFLPPHHTFCTTINIITHYIRGSYVYISSGIKHIKSEIKYVQPKHLLLVPLFIEEFHRKIMNELKENNTYEYSFNKINNIKNHITLSEKRKCFPIITKIFGNNIKYLISGGAPLSQHIIDDFYNMGLPIINGYGITECSPLISCNLVNHQTKNSVGIPLNCIDLKINAKNDANIGEIYVKSPCNFIGYYNNEKKTKAAFDNGYFKTGDIGYLKNNNLFIIGRANNMIVLSNGENVYPEELEKLILTINEVKEVMVKGVFNNKNQTITMLEAVIVINEDLINSEIEQIKHNIAKKIEELNQTLAYYKRISKITIRETPFPRNSSHKIIRQR